MPFLVLDPDAVIHDWEIDIRVDWNGGLVGGFSFGSSKFGGPDPFTSAWSASFDGEYDDLTDQPGKGNIVESCQWSRGSDDLRSAVLAGTGSIVVLDEDGILNPANPASPLAGKLIAMRPVFIKLRPVFVNRTPHASPILVRPVDGCIRGFLREAPVHDASEIPAKTTLTITDMSVILEGVFPTIASTGQTTTGHAIKVILVAAGLTDSNYRSLDDGDTIADFSADGSKNALDLIGDLLQAERGTFFIDGNGVATYRDRHDRFERASIATVDGILTGVQTGGGSVDDVVTRETVTANGGVPQTYTDQLAAIASGYRDGGQIDTTYLDTDAAAAWLAQAIVSGKKNQIPAGTFTVADSITDASEAVIRELGDRITVPTDGAGVTGTEGDFFIEQIQGSLTGVTLQIVWTVTERTEADDAIRFGVYQFADGTPWRY